MIIRIPKPKFTPRVMLQRAGYVEFLDPNTGETSFVRRMGPNFYPRFHIYVEESPTEMKISLHLDQKQASYRGTRKHAGEYAGPTVETEADRIYHALVG